MSVRSVDATRYHTHTVHAPASVVAAPTRPHIRRPSAACSGTSTTGYTLRRLAALSLLLVPLRAGAQGILAYSDQTANAGITADHAPNGIGNFRAGGAVGDFNNDGWQDIYFPGGGGTPDILYINNQDGTFTDRAAEWGIADTHRGTGAAVADFDNDGWLDIFVTSFGSELSAQPGKHRLYRNIEGSSFLDVAVAAGVSTTSPTRVNGEGGAWGDYDLDGDLDLAVPGWDDDEAGNRLFRNNGDGTFTDVTTAAGLDVLIGVDGFAPRFADMDFDGWPELLWVGDFGTSTYLVNNHDGTFADLTADSGTSLGGTEMGHTVADFNRDGRLDWYVTQISENHLYINNGDHTYLESAASAGVEYTGWGWATVAIDMDHDGWQDIVAVSQSPPTTYAFLNLAAVPGELTFDEVSTDIGLVANVSGRGLANFDYDNDGDQDVIVFPYVDTVRLLRNDLSGTQVNWIRIFLDNLRQPDLPPHGVGANVFVTVGGWTQIGRIDGGSNYMSQSELSAHFGLGSAAVIDEIRVEWPGGTVQSLFNIPANQTLTITALDCEPSVDCNGNGEADVCDVARGDSADCNGNGIPDECDAGGVSLDCDADLVPDECEELVDCNGNGTFDACDVSWSQSEDCNDDIVPDECQISDLTVFVAESNDLSPLHYDSPQSFHIPTPPQALGSVTFTLTVSADLDSLFESITVYLNGGWIWSAFRSGAHECPGTPDVTQFTMTASAFNDLVGNGDALVEFIPTADVGVCLPPGYISAKVEYEIDIRVRDCNHTGVPDDCEAGDHDGDGLITLADFGPWSLCLAGPDVMLRDFCCRLADFDGDGDVDLVDHTSYQRAFVAP